MPGPDAVAPRQHIRSTPRGWWFRDAVDADPAPPAPPLSGHETADIVIVGGGYTGMWTAYFLKESSPDLRITVLEREECGAGPSGRNGGFLNGWWDELPTLVELFGQEEAVEACRAVGRGVAEIGAWCELHGVDAWFRHEGYLQVAASPAQEGSWSAAVDMAQRLGVGDEFVELTADEVRARCASPTFGGGAFMRDGATVQPARLARGLRRVLLERGVTIHEGTTVRDLERGPAIRAITDGGSVRAEQAVLALNAWAGRWPGLRRTLVTWGSHIVLTAPAPERIAELGWGGVCIADSRTSVHYFRTTKDGRVAFGGGGGRASWLGDIGSRVDQDPDSISRAAEGLRRLLPNFAEVPIEEAWGGPIDISTTHLPFFGTLPPGNVHFGAGYSGNGVGPSRLGGRILATLAQGGKDGPAALPMVGYRPRRFPPEPLRSVGAHVMREAIIRYERAMERGRRPGPLVRLLARVPRKIGYHLGPE